MLYRDFNFAYKNGIIKERLGADEYKSIPWDKYEKGDPEFLFEFYRRIAFKIGEFGTVLGEGSGRLAERWKFPEEYFKDHEVAHWKMGHPKHHSVEDYPPGWRPDQHAVQPRPDVPQPHQFHSQRVAH